MHDFLLAMIVITFLLVLVVMLPYFGALRRFILAVKEEQDEVWKQLGSPVPFSGFSPRSAALVGDYLLRQKYSALPGQVPALGRRARTLLIAVLTSSAALFASALAAILGVGPRA